MKIFLTSTGLPNNILKDFFISVLPKKPKDCTVLMIAYAQSPEEKNYVEISKKELINLGIKNVDIFNLKDKKFFSEKKHDVIYVCGGNTFAILDRMRKTSTDKFIKKSVKEYNALYFGVSAGSIIAGPNIAIAGFGTSGDKNDVGLKDLHGLAFTDTAIFPHFTPDLDKEVEKIKSKVSYPIVWLADDEAFFSDNSIATLINKKLI